MNIPNLESLVAGITNKETPRSEAINSKKNIESPPEMYKEKTEKVNPNSHELWNLFLDDLNKPKDEIKKERKLQLIDCEIIETINLCNFNVSTTKVINSILRTFLIAHIEILNKMRKEKVASLFDKYHPKD